MRQSARKIENIELVEKIKEIKAQHPSWGSRRVWGRLLHQEKIMIGEIAVRRIMKEHCLIVTQAKMNCWEFWKCRRYPGGERVVDLGVCPAAIEETLDGVNRGTKAGRSCWVVAGTLCGSESHGTHAQKCGNCAACDFYQRVRAEERESFRLSIASLLNRLKEAEEKLR